MYYKVKKTVNLKKNSIRNQQIRTCLFRYLRDIKAIDCQTSRALLWYITWYRRSIRDIDAPRLVFSSHSAMNKFHKHAIQESPHYGIHMKTFRTFQRHIMSVSVQDIKFVERIIEGQMLKDCDYVSFFKTQPHARQKAIVTTLNAVAQHIGAFLQRASNVNNEPIQWQKKVSKPRGYLL